MQRFKYIGKDNFGNRIFRNVKTDIIYKTVDDDNKLYTCGNDIVGEAGFPVFQDEEIILEGIPNEAYRFQYMLLSRKQADCEYFLNHGNRSTHTLPDIPEHIKEMKDLWNVFPEDQKPEWLTMDQIIQYEQRMIHDLIKSIAEKAQEWIELSNKKRFRDISKLIPSNIYRWDYDNDDLTEDQRDILYIKWLRLLANEKTLRSHYFSFWLNIDDDEKQGIQETPEPQIIHLLFSLTNEPEIDCLMFNFIKATILFQLGLLNE